MSATLIDNENNEQQRDDRRDMTRTKTHTTRTEMLNERTIFNCGLSCVKK